MVFLEVVALVVVDLAGLYLLVLGVMLLFVPSRASHFLLGFAGSQALHFAELLTRFVVGAAFVLYAPKMLFSGIFYLFGWVLLITTAGLLLVPWQWHHHFAQQTVPRVTRFITLIGIVSIVFSGFILAAVLLGIAGII